MPYIYKITNKLNTKIYIGKTLNTIDERWKQHCHDCKKKKIENRPLYMAINKYGIENFSIEEVEECSVEELNDKERYWIEYYGSFKDGYNATIGGDGKPYVDYSLVMSYWKEGKNSKQICEIMNIDAKTVRKILKIYKISPEERMNRGHLIQSKKVKQIFPDGDFVIYSCISDAYKAIKKRNSSHIQEVCNGKKEKAYGYKWEWVF